MRIMNVIAEGEVASAGEAMDGLQALNDMLNGWRSMGVDVGHAQDYTDLSADLETATLTSDYREAVTFLLADVFATEFNRTLPLQAQLKVRNSWRTLQANFLVTQGSEINSGLRRLPSQYWGASRFR